MRETSFCVRAARWKKKEKKSDHRKQMRSEGEKKSVRNTKR